MDLIAPSTADNEARSMQSPTVVCLLQNDKSTNSNKSCSPQRQNKPSQTSKNEFTDSLISYQLSTVQTGNGSVTVPTGSPSRGGDVRVYVFGIDQPSLPIPFFILFLCLFLSLRPIQSYFIPNILPTTLRFLTLFSRSYLCLIGPLNYNYV